MYVSNEDSGDLTVIDAAKDAVVGTIPVGKRPRGIRVDAAGRRLFAAVSGSPRSPPGVDPATLPPPDRSADGIAVIELSRGAVSATISSGQDPESFDLVESGAGLLVSNEETGEASFVDVATGRVTAEVPVGTEPEGVTVSPDGALAAVTSESEHHVALVEVTRRTVIARVPTCARPRNAVFTRDGALAFVTCEQGAAIAVIDVRAHTAHDPIPLTPGSRPMGVVLSPDGKRL